MDAGRWNRWDTLAVSLIAVAGAVLRSIRLSVPGTAVFDEIYYLRGSCELGGVARRACAELPLHASAELHPPLARRLIGAGMRLFGTDPAAWRIASTIVGVIGVVLLYVLVWKLLSSTLAAGLAAGALAIDPLHLVFSRVATLDIFTTTFGVAALCCMAFDRDALLDKKAVRSRHLRGRPWRLAAGALVGAAAASKWSGFFLLPGVLVVAVAWETFVARKAGRAHPLDSALRDQGLPIAISLILVPLFVYSLTFIGDVHGSLLAWPWSGSSWYRALWDHNLSVFLEHGRFYSLDPYRSPAWSWPLLKNPVTLHLTSDSTGAEHWILGTGSPVVWWIGSLSLFAAAVRWIRQRSPYGPEGLLLAGTFWTFGPWLVLSAFRPTMYFFYFLPTVPFLCAGIGYGLWRLRGRVPLQRVAAVVVTAAASIFFIFMFPVLTSVGLRPEQREARALFKDCSDVGWQVVVPRSSGGEVTKRLPFGQPAEGWCWDSFAVLRDR